MLRSLIPCHRQLIRTGEYFLAHGEPEVHLIPRLVTPGSTVIDVGAHIGDYTYALCKQVAPSGKVIAIEPQPNLARRLRRATEKLRLPVTVHCCALSSKEGEANLLTPTEAGVEKLGYATLEQRTTGGTVCRVPIHRLDDLCRDIGAISFIKIDVEGHELEVLRGSTETLKHHRPNLLVEIEQRHSAVPISETLNFITSQGYRGEFLDRDQNLQPLATFDPAIHQADPRLAGRGYVSNFIFRPIDDKVLMQNML